MKYLRLLFLGIAAGTWLFFSPGTLFVVLITIALFYIFNLNLREYSNRKIIITICVIAIAARFIFAISNYYIAYSRGMGADLIGDARAYSGSGQYMAEVLTGRPMPDVDGNEPLWAVTLRDLYKGSIPAGGYRVDYFAKYVGLIYAMFGYDPIAVKFTNSFLSIFTGILLFFLIKDMFSVKTAQIGLALSIFWPSLFLWSVTGTKDTLTIFLIVLCLFVFVKLKKYINIAELLCIIAMLAVTNYGFSMLFLLGILIIRNIKKFIFKQHILSDIIIPLLLVLVMKTAAEGLKLIRFHIFMPLLIAFSLSLVSFLNKRLLIFLLIIIFCFGIFSPFYVNKYKIDIDRRFNTFAETTIAIQIDQLKGARSGYRIYPDRFYNEDYMEHPHDNISFIEFITAYFKGIIYVLFSPFPWSINNKISIFIYFQTILYYILAPFILLGILVSLRYRWRNVLPVMIFMLIIASMYALFEGNIGTVFRHRDILMILFLFFGAIGISRTLNILSFEGYMGETG